VLILRIRQAETALKDGRLDEAYELAGDANLRAHRRGQELIGRLARAFVQRGHEHLAEMRCTQALADCEKAGKLGGNLTEAAALRAEIAEQQTAQQRKVRQTEDAVAATRQYLDEGRLSLADGALAELDARSVRVAGFQRQVSARRSEADVCLTRVQQALERQDFDAAIDGLCEAGQLHAACQEWHELTAQVTSVVLQQLRSAIDQGRLPLADALIRRLKSLAGETTDLHELSGIMQQCYQAMGNIEQGKLRPAGEILGRLEALLPDASWLDVAHEAVQQAAGSLEAVRGGPLGLLSVSLMSSAEQASKADADDINQTQRVPLMDKPLPSRFMLKVDGVGSYLVLRDRCVTIGPISSSRRPDVGLMAEPGLPVANIERTDEDYFITCDRPIAVNGSPVTRRLLADGDTIALSPRCRVKFALPHAANISAVLSLSGTRLPQGDARQVILMDESLVIGPGSAAQVRADVLTEPVVLHVRDGRLLCESKQQVLLDEQPMTVGEGIPMDAHVCVGAVSFVVTQA